MNGMSRVEYELRAQRDTVRELRERLEELLNDGECTAVESEEINELADMLEDYLDCVQASTRLLFRADRGV
jgi:predicted house-cleaning noncanonical NTP pyrophosphatase (MazG superfamily)